MSTTPPQIDIREAETPVPAGVKRRSEIPRGELNRRLFDRYAYLKHRYSFTPLERDTNGEYMIPEIKLREFLTRDGDELRGQSALISLLLHLKQLRAKEGKEKDAPFNNKVGVYRLVSPTVKDLNDSYLGPEQTDNFIAELHTVMQTVLGEHAANVLRVTFKSGIFIMDMNHHGNGHGPDDLEETLPDKLAIIAETGKELLLKQIPQRLEYLTKRLGGDEDQKILEDIDKVERLDKTLRNGKKYVDIAFGFDDLHNGHPEDAFIAILNAERAANIAALNGNGNGNSNGNGNGHNAPNGDGTPKPEKLKVKNYSHVDLIMGGLDAQEKASIAYDEKTQDILPQWQEFFVLDKTTRQVRMNTKMINTYRHRDRFEKSERYIAMTKEEQKAFNKKMDVFDYYYKKMNIVDVLKDFVIENFGSHLRRVERIVDLLERTDQLLNDPDADLTAMHVTLDKIDEELGVSLKNEGQMMIGNTRAFIRALMKDEGDILDEDKTVVLFGDIIGLGALNQSDYESSLLSLIGMLPIEMDEWQEALVDKEKTRELIKRALALVQHTPEFKKTMMCVGDAATRYIRDNDRMLYEVMGGFPVINAEGGDEKVVVYQSKRGSRIPETEDELEDKLKELSKETNSRIVAVMGSLGLSSMKEYDPRNIAPQHRTELVKLLNLNRWSEESMKDVKYFREIRGKSIVKVENIDKI